MRGSICRASLIRASAGRPRADEYVSCGLPTQYLRNNAGRALDSFRVGDYPLRATEDFAPVALEGSYHVEKRAQPFSKALG